MIFDRKDDSKTGQGTRKFEMTNAALLRIKQKLDFHCSPFTAVDAARFGAQDNRH